MKKKKKEPNDEESFDEKKKKKKEKKKIDYLNLLQIQLNNTLLPDCELIEKIGELDI